MNLFFKFSNVLFNSFFPADRTHFNYEQPASGHMAFRKGEVFHVVDTLYKGVVGAWQAFRVGELHQNRLPFLVFFRKDD